jgi:hypothetical protein
VRLDVADDPDRHAKPCRPGGPEPVDGVGFPPVGADVALRNGWLAPWSSRSWPSCAVARGPPSVDARPLAGLGRRA